MHTPTVLTETVADTLMALVLSTARRVVEVAERVKAGEWTASIGGPDWYGTDVHHKTLGINGMGFGSAWRWHNVRTLRQHVHPSITRRHHKKHRTLPTPATVIWIPCYKSQISFA